MSRKKLWFTIQILVTLSLLLLLFRAFDWASLGSLLQQIPIWFYPLSLALLFLAQLAYALRWYIILRSLGVDVPLIRLIEQYLIAIFFSNFLPTAIGGDWARVYYLGQKKGYVNAGASVFIDRFLGFFAMTVLSTLFIWALHLTTPAFIVARDLLTVGSLLFACGFIGVGILPVETWLRKTLIRLPQLARPIEMIIRFMAHVKQASLKPGVVIAAAFLVIVYFLLVGAIYHTYFSFSGSDIPMLPLMAALMSIGILTNVPISVNGIGLREQLHYLLFINLGISKEVSVSMSVIILFDFLLISVVGCVFWLRLRLENRSQPLAVEGEAHP